VGDVAVDDVIGWAAQTFGTLPARRKPQAYDEMRNLTLVSGLRHEHEVSTEVEGETVQVYYPTTDGRDSLLRRRLTMLARVLNERLRETIREQLGEAYSPSASSDSNDIYPGYGMIEVSTSADTGRAADVLEACLKIGDELAESGVTEEELSRLREPLLKSLRDGLRNNGFWMGVLSRSQSKFGHLDEYRRLLDDYEQMRVDELSELAEQYLERSNASTVIVRQAESSGS
jgi:zinc protease